MSLVIEDGTIVEGANSYVTSADFVAYALTLGVVIEGSADPVLIEAAEFIDSHEARLKGAKVSRDQPLAFPREGAVIEGFEWEDTEIPRQVILCQMQLALDIAEGIDPYNPPQSEAVGVKRKRVEGAVEVEYAVSDAQKLSRRSRSMALLMSLMVHSGLSITLVRA